MKGTAVLPIALHVALAAVADPGRKPAVWTAQERRPATNRAPLGGKKRLLLITESKGFIHDVVQRKVTLAEGLDPEHLPKIKGLELTLDPKNKKKIIGASFTTWPHRHRRPASSSAKARSSSPRSSGVWVEKTYERPGRQEQL